jgi:hypothetical protein
MKSGSRESGAGTLARLREAKGTELTWQKRKAGKTYELRDADALYGTLERRSVFGSLATAETAEGRFTFKRVGFLRSRVTVRTEGSEENLAVLEPGFGGEGPLVFADGRRLQWSQESFWRQIWAMKDGTGRTLFTIHSAGFTGGRGVVELAAGEHRTRDLALVTALAWYVVMLMAQDGGGAMAAAAAG